MTRMNEHPDAGEGCGGETINALDRATRDRLARLASMPVDTTNVEKALRAALTQQEAERTDQGAWKFAKHFPAVWRRTAWSAAAVLAIAVLLGLVMLTFSTSPVIASPVEVAQIHQEMLANPMAMDMVRDLQQARDEIRAHWSDAPVLPQQGDAHVACKCCCVKKLDHRPVACLMVEHEGQKVTVMVAHASDIKPPAGVIVERNNHRYVLGQSNGLTMVMTEHDARWLCLVGDTNSDNLINLAQDLGF